MKSSMFERNILLKIFSALSPLVFTAIVMLAIISGINSAEESNRAGGLRILEESIQRAVVKCYAVEGNYPSDLEYIERHYGVRIDRTKYMVEYDIFASNIMPAVYVMERPVQ